MSAYLDLPRRSEADALLDRYRRERATRLQVQGCCGLCVRFDAGWPFGFCLQWQKLREADDVICTAFERADIGHGDVGSAGQ